MPRPSSVQAFLRRGPLGAVIRAAWPAKLLIIVATLQLFASLGHTLSPWKGGGFGMFSTVDSPAQREIKIWIVDAAGKEHAAVLPDMSRNKALECRAWPRKECLTELATTLAKLRWAPLTIAEAQTEYQRLSEFSQEGAVDNDVLLLQEVAGATAKKEAIVTDVLQAYTQDEQPSQGSIQLNSVRLHLIQIHFVRSPTQLRTHLMLNVEVERL